jgi:hypothetical protein
MFFVAIYFSFSKPNLCSNFEKYVSLKFDQAQLLAIIQLKFVIRESRIGI